MAHLKKAIHSFRLRLHSSLWQSGSAQCAGFFGRTEVRPFRSLPLGIVVQHAGLPGLLLGVVETGRLEHRIMRLLDERMPWARRWRVIASAGCLLALGSASVGFGMFGVRTSQAQSMDNKSVAFDAATIRPAGPKGPPNVGFKSSPGGEVYYGGGAKLLIEMAFDLQDYQVAGAPDWTSLRSPQMFVINAVPPKDSPSRKLSLPSGFPTKEQQLMLQSVLRERFGLKYHFETKEGDVYLLSRGNGALELQPPKNPTREPRALIFGQHDDTIVVSGFNTTADYLASRMSGFLRLPVINQTGISGTYDFELPLEGTGSHELDNSTLLDLVNRLGLKLKRGRGPVQTMVIDHIDLPTEN